jgi:tRNA threonylcarbamoyladenosine biosynthesis protein TsaB
VILSLDTTSEFGSIALTNESGTIAEVLLHSPDGFSHILFPHIEKLLAHHRVSLEDIHCFAAASGPGSFTGVRVCLTAVKGMAEALRRPVVAVSNLQALAFFATADLRATVLDARRGQVYGAVYDSKLRIVQPEVVMNFPDWVRTLPGAVQFVAQDFGPFRPFVEGEAIVAPRALAAAIGQIALQSPAVDPAAVDANYVRRSDAELFWKE